MFQGVPVFVFFRGRKKNSHEVRHTQGTRVHASNKPAQRHMADISHPSGDEGVSPSTPTTARQQGTPPHLPSLSCRDLKNTRHTSRLRLGELLKEVGGLVRPSAPNFSSQDDQSCSAVALAQLGVGALLTSSGLVEGCAVHVNTSPLRLPVASQR